jgi:multidrug efflux system membrane fusion protein
MRPGLLIAILASTALACSREPNAAPRGQTRGGAPAFAVEVVPVASRTVEYTVDAVGSVEAFEVVQVTSRVPGAVERVTLREGQHVQQGDILVEIEPERYRLATAEARAALEKARAALAEAESGLARRNGANERNPGLIPGEELEAWRTRAATARAEVAATEAAVHLAERNERDSRVQAPFAGIIQTRDVRTGEYVQLGSLLTTLIRRDPLLIRFQVPDGDAGRLHPGMEARFRVRNVEGTHRARLAHVAESADLASRMVTVTGEVVDPVAELRPGAFAEISVPIGSSSDAPVIPQTAVRPSERGFLAFVVSGAKANERMLELGLRTPDGLVEVRRGLAAGESLVVRGAEALHDGAKVRLIAPAGGEGEPQ